MHNLLLANSVEYYDERVAPWSFSLIVASLNMFSLRLRRQIKHMNKIYAHLRKEYKFCSEINHMCAIVS